MPPLDPGTAVGSFRIVRLLRGGRGAGAVYEATGGGLDRAVALKVFDERLSESREFRERFRREAPRIAAVEHPNITPTYEAGSSAHGLYLAMQLVDGRTLAEHLERRPLAPSAALELLGPLAEALDLAHASGVLHRDLKPEKILVGEGEAAFLTGFSIARSGVDGRNGRAPGRAQYEAPEQVRGEPLRRRGEVYSFGALLYEAMAGYPPSPLPEPLGEILGRALAENPAERPGSAGELVGDLRRALDGRMPATPRSTQLPDSHRSDAARLERRRARTLVARRRRALRAAPVVALVAVAGLAGWYAPSLLGPAEEPRAPAPASGPAAPAATSDAYAAVLSRTLERLNERRATLVPRLERARTAPTQARAASALERAHSAAATALAGEPRTPQERRTNTAIVAALREVAAAYRGMAGAGRRGDARTFRAEAARARRGEMRVRSAVRGLTALGYSLE